MFETDSESPNLILFSKPRSNRAGMGDDKIVSAQQVPEKELETEKMKALHRRLWGFFLYEIERQHENRNEQSLDVNFYDNEQWTEEEKAVLRERGQVPLVYNVIATTLNWLIGSERRNRTDFKVLPRKKESGRAAELKTQLLKYISDTSNSEFAKSRAFQDMVKVGVGWLESGAQDTDDGEPVFDRFESWRNMIWDSTAQEYDLSDARYVARHKWLDEDVAVAIRQTREAMIRESTAEISHDADDLGDEHMDSVEDFYADGDLVYNRGDLFGDVARPRVRMVEMWFTLPVMTKRLSGGEFSGEIFDQFSPGHMQSLQSGEADLVKRPMMRMHVALMTSVGFIHVSESPYRHNNYPFTPMWCYRRDKDGMPYGVIRGLRDIQQDINKRASKALHILSTNKVIMEKGAVDDLEAFEEEVSRPDGILVVNDGKRLDLNADRELAPAHLELMSRSIAMIQQQSGVTDESLGRTTNATSGKAIIARQDQGALATAAIYDNQRHAHKLHGEKMLSLIEQFMSEKKQFRITNSRGVPTYVTVNDGLPENDIVRTKADFVISEDQWSVTNRESRLNTLLQAMGSVQLPPEAFMAILDLLVEMMDVPFRDEIVARIRNITGMKDPEADPDAPPTPEEQAKMQAEAEMMAMQKRAAEAEIAKTEADAAEKMARAEKVAVEIRKILATTVGDNVAAQKSALETALAVLSVPQAADVADTILGSAGYTGANMPDVPPSPAPAMPQQPMPAGPPPVGMGAPPVGPGPIPPAPPGAQPVL